MTDCVICYFLTANSITLDHYIVKDWLGCGYSRYQDLLSVVYATAVGEYRKQTNQKGRYNNSTEVNTIEILSV